MRIELFEFLDMEENDCKVVKKKIVYFINYLDGCKEDIENLSFVFTKLWYEIKILDNLKSSKELRDEINEEKRKAIITEAVIIFFGYGFGLDFMFFGDDIITYHQFCKIFDFHPDKNIAVFTHTSKTDYKDEYVLPLRKEDDEDLRYTHHMIFKTYGNCENGSIFAKGLLKILDDFYNSPKENQELDLSKVYSFSIIFY